MPPQQKITPTNPRLSSLIADVERGSIKIPAFQRHYVWKDDQIFSLLDSINQGFPVGSLLLWSTSEKLEEERNVAGFKLPPTTVDYPVLYVLDGQQRLSTLYGVFNSDAPTDDEQLAARFQISFVPSTQAFVRTSETDPALSIELRNLLDTTKLLPELARFDAEGARAIAAVTERFKDYEFPVITIKERTNIEVSRIFQRINSSATKLTTFELLSAWTWSDQFDLRVEIQNLLARLSSEGYEEIKQSDILRCITAVVSESVDEEALVNVDPPLVVAAMAAVERGMNAAIDFLDKEFAIRNMVFLPFPIMLVPLVRFFAIQEKPDAAQVAQVKRWFWHCIFTQRYQAGTNRLVTEDLKTMVALADDSDPTAFASLKTAVDPDLFTKTWRINSTAAKATICLLGQNNPRTFLTGRVVDLGESLSAYNSRQFHHIYPKAHLQTQGVSFHEANVIANICMLTAADNNEISDRDPQVYFAQIPPAHRDQVFEAAFISPESRSGNQPFKDFVQGRAAALAAFAQALIEGNMATPPDGVIAAAPTP